MVRHEAPDAQPVATWVAIGGALVLGLTLMAVFLDLARGPGNSHALGVAMIGAGMGLMAAGLVVVRLLATLRELRRANEHFLQARTDDLTGLLNRRGFLEQLDDALATGDSVLAVLMIDLNGFKEVNDSLGHPAGDELLTVVSRRFELAVADRGSMARLGGDEFGVLLPGTAGAALAIAAELHASLEESVTVDGIAIRVGASIGVVTSPEHGTVQSELVRAADVAMYDAKRAGAPTSVYSPELDPHSRDRLALIEDLRHAAATGAFAVHFQPTLDVRSLQVVGMEALVRWHHPRRGWLVPADFVPLAERVGLMPAITRAVLDQAVDLLARLHLTGFPLRLSVNLSAPDLVDDSLPAYVFAALGRHDLSPALLTVEVTEAALAADPARADRVLRVLRGAGVRIAIDDFGIGYSGMVSLLDAPVDELKLDQAFMHTTDRDPRAHVIVRSAVDLGHALGFDVVAEGVETAGSLESLRRQGVKRAQGYHLTRPLDPDALLSFVAEHRLLEPTVSPPAHSA